MQIKELNKRWYLGWTGVAGALVAFMIFFAMVKWEWKIITIPWFPHGRLIIELITKINGVGVDKHESKNCVTYYMFIRTHDLHNP